MEILAKRIKELRQTKNIYQKDCATFLQIGVRSWQRYEAGEVQPEIEKIVQIADFFNVSTDYLLGRTDDATPPATHRRTPSARGGAEATKKPSTEKP